MVCSVEVLVFLTFLDYFNYFFRSNTINFRILIIQKIQITRPIWGMACMLFHMLRSLCFQWIRRIITVFDDLTWD